MSHKKIPSQCIVVDASIACAAGNQDAVHPTGIQCREFLKSLRSICHRLASGPMIQAEWYKHGSKFAFQWLTSMQSMGKLRLLDDSVPSDLLELIEASSADRGVVEIILKDAHLLTAALVSDLRIASLDDTVRAHTALCLTKESTCLTLVWVNPTQAEEGPIEWLEQGAPLEEVRTLLRYRERLT